MTRMLQKCSLVGHLMGPVGREDPVLGIKAGQTPGGWTGGGGVPRLSQRGGLAPGHTLGSDQDGGE